MSKLNPTPSQIKYREFRRLKKQKYRESNRINKIARFIKSGCLQEGQDLSQVKHDFKPWNCYCTWGCDCCHISARCDKCDEYK